MNLDPDRQTVYGVDFSAAANSAGAGTWIARCVPDGRSLVVRDLRSASEHLDLDSTDRDDVLPALVDALGDAESAVVGFDFPFSLPAWVLGDAGEWREFVEATPERWGVLGDVGGPEDLYRRLTDAAEDPSDRRRRTDDDHGGQDPAGWRIKTQTYYGISAVLRRVIEQEDVCVPPVLSVSDPRLAVLETYPASVFDRLPGGERTGYKGDQRRHVEARRRNVGALVDAGVVFDGDAARDCAVATDDALDAVAAAVAAARNYPGALEAEHDAVEHMEARIYA